MIEAMKHFALEPLADLGFLARFETEAQCQGYFRALLGKTLPWVLDIVCAYKSLAVYHDPARITPLAAEAHLKEWLSASLKPGKALRGKLHEIPCCYDLGEDLKEVARLKGIRIKELIGLHSSELYTVHAIGFSPGFPYLGYLPEGLQGVPRLASPRLKVPAGSVGLTGVQTGIYPEEKPGGWRLIGRTPLLLVDVAENYFGLKVGDQVKFNPITKAAFNRLLGKRLGE